MRILYTGMNGASLVTATKKRDIKNAIGAFVEALRDDGHDVDWRKPTMDEDVSRYDVVIANVVPPMSLVADNAIAVMKLMVEAKRAGKTVIASIDDWQSDISVPRMRYLAEAPDLMIGRSDKSKAFRSKYLGYDWLCESPSRFSNYAREWCDYEFSTIVPAFGFGTPEGYAALTRKMGHTYRLDPTPYVSHDYAPAERPEDRERVWLMSSLACHSKWLSQQEWTWPGQYHLTVRPKHDPPPTFELLDPVKQPEMIRRYAEVWGVILMPYKKLIGSGWWRDRFFTAPRSGAVLWADPDDAGLLGRDFSPTVEEIESMDTEELLTLSARQRERVESFIWTKSELQAQLNRMLTTELSR